MAGQLMRSGWRARQHANLSGAIFGVITAAAVIAAAAGHDAPLEEILTGTVVTLVVFWLAHVYAEVVAHHISGRHRPSLSAVRAAMVAELPVLEGPMLSLLLLLAGVLGLLEHDTAINLALWAVVAQLVAWGVAYARQQGWPWLGAAVAGAVNGSLGVIVIVLKALIH
jgi:hypothetical protein